MFDFIKNLFGQANNVNNLAQIISEGAMLIDVRTPAEFESGYVKGSINIPLDKLNDNLNKLNPQKNIVVFCRSGNRSAQAQSILIHNGFKNVINGGSWQNVANYVPK